MVCNGIGTSLALLEEVGGGGGLAGKKNQFGGGTNLPDNPVREVKSGTIGIEF